MMTHAPLTPTEDAELTAPVVEYSPATVAYDEAFENDLMNAILNSSSPTPRTPRSPPLVAATNLPVPLNSDLRTQPSPIPGILLTHPNGYHTGGPGPTHSIVNDFATKFIEEHEIQDAGQLERVVEERIKLLMDTARERMREREEAVRKNEEISKKIEELEVQRDTERRVAEKIKEGMGKRRE